MRSEYKFLIIIVICLFVFTSILRFIIKNRRSSTKESFTSRITCEPTTFDSLSLNTENVVNPNDEKDVKALRDLLNNHIKKIKEEAKEREDQDQDQKKSDQSVKDQINVKVKSINNSLYKDVIKYGFSKLLFDLTKNINDQEPIYKCERVIVSSFKHDKELSNYSGEADTILINADKRDLYAKHVKINFIAINGKFMLNSFDIIGIMSQDKLFDTYSSSSKSGSSPTFSIYSLASFS